MERVVFPCAGLTAGFEDTAVAAGAFAVLRRQRSVSTFDLATLAAQHRVHLSSWHLMEPFIQQTHCEIEVRGAGSYDEAQECVRPFQAMLYLEGLSPFIMPFGASHSTNEYAGINQRDSLLQVDDMPPEPRTGLTSKDATIEVWPHEPALTCMTLDQRGLMEPPRRYVSAEDAYRAADAVEKWTALEEVHRPVKAARVALLTAPMIPDLGSSLLHIWQGIETLFPEVQSEVSFRLALLVAQLAAPFALPSATYEKSRASHKQRSNAAHGNMKRITMEHW